MPVPAAGPGRLVLLCDRRLADAAVTDPDRQLDLLRRLSLVDAATVMSDAGPLRLEFGGIVVNMVQGASAQSRLQAMMAEDGASLPPSAATVDAAVCVLDLVEGGLDRATAAQRLCALAALLGPLWGARSLYWQAARLWTSANALADAVMTMESTGLPPILHLIGFVSPADPPPDREQVSTRGLDWFAGFELRVEAPADMPKQEVVRRAARLAIDSMLNGDPGGPVNLPGLAVGERVLIEPLQWQDGRWHLPIVITARQRP